MSHVPLIAATFIPIILLGISAIYDLCCRRVPNYLTGVAAIIGLLLPWYVFDSSVLLKAYLGGILGLLMFIPPYAAGVMGAGDVKMLGTVGLYVGIDKLFLLILYTALAGGVLTIFYLIGQVLPQYLSHKKPEILITTPIELPYIVAIFGGFISMLFAERLT